MKIYSIEVFNLASIGQYSGEVIPKGCLGVTVSDMTFGNYKYVTAADLDLSDKAFEKFSPHELARIKNGSFKALYAQCGELINTFAHVEGTRDGFGDRTFSLRIEEPSVIFPKIKAVRTKAFKGCLWDSYAADIMVASYLKTRIFHIGARTKSNDCYGSCRATEAFINRISKAVVIGKPIQGDFNAEAKEPQQ